MYVYKKIFLEIIKNLLIIFLILVLLFPLYYLIVLSLKSNTSINNGDFSVLLKEWNFKNFSFLKDAFFWNALAVSFGAIICLIIVRVFTYTLFAWGFLYLNKYIKKIFYIILIIVSLIPEFSIFLALKMVISSLKIMNVLTWFNLSTNSIFSIFLLFNLISVLEKSKEKVNIYGKIDNLKLIEKFYFLIWKEIKGLILLTIIFSTISMWNSYLWPSFLLSNNEEQTISIWFRNLGQKSLGSNFVNIQSAGALISLIVPLTIYILFSKKINKFIF
ncbi:ABC transporter permease family protein [Mesomycoplasma neurolyticum]|uniref:Uncharacterized protein n=1 Tax=Mesomycoplasma neurolyticum TaxID=2120 RepID=A0A449A4J1_9BACT|nr:carbohydrate ABC transporter permease [Mesomycoplasma neurolyticum]VEU59200.1 Uncharacterised protein [Mesomycoplasma neurolyticum]